MEDYKHFLRVVAKIFFWGSTKIAMAAPFKAMFINTETSVYRNYDSSHTLINKRVLHKEFHFLSCGKSSSQEY
jgi:hypothetical protein